MSKFSMMFRLLAGFMDKKRDMKLKPLEDVTALYDIPYADGGKYNLLDVYYPKGTKGVLPVIVSVHGGGFVYGTKEVYKHYGMFLAQQGFVFVNFNYHLAPKAKFPTQLTEINQVFEWMVRSADKYHLDLNQVFMVGDSAGAQLTSHFCTIYANPEFAAKFPFRIPKEARIRAVALNCGIYDISAKAMAGREQKKGFDPTVVHDDYLGKDREHLEPLLEISDHITADFPPAFVMTSWYDFLRDGAKPMLQLLESKGVKAVYRLYGKEGQKYMGHVFHCNMNLREAKECNLDEVDFFRENMD